MDIDNLSWVAGVTFGLIVGDFLGTRRPSNTGVKFVVGTLGYIIGGLMAYWFLQWLT